MKLLAKLIVDKRKIFLLIFTLITIVSGLLISKVTLNYDMASFLPNGSSMKTGTQLMNDEFDQTNYLNVMFGDITENEKDEISDYILSLENVESLEIEENEYTLFTVEILGDSHQEEAENVLEKIRETYTDREIYTSGEVVDNVDYDKKLSKIILYALIILLVILFIMSSSWIEPGIFLITIGFAIVINMGTNYFLGSISNITSSIAAILQLALSMDYSIMLIDRYRQEKLINPDKNIAMKETIKKGFAAIAGSSVTTIVGLLCLLFMSFTIGKDMGLVLAKGVAISLICILFVLPALILIFDKPIEKTRKKVPAIKIGRLSKFSYKFRWGTVVLIILIFIGGFIMKSNIDINYVLPASSSDKEKIEEYFPSDNTLVVLYKNEDEEKVNGLLSYLDEYEGVNEVSGYSNTLGELYTSDEFAEEMEMDVEEVRLLFYYYSNSEENRTIKFEDFINFVNNHILDNEMFSEYMDEDSIGQFNELAKFASKSKMTTGYNPYQMASLLGMATEDIEKLYIYYYSLYGGPETGSMTIETLINFIVNDIVPNDEYAGMFDATALAGINQMQMFTQVDFITTPMPSAQTATILGMDEATMDQLYTLYFATTGLPDTGVIDLFSLVNFILSDVVTDPMYSAMFDTETVAQLQFLQYVMGASISGTELSCEEMGALLGMDSEQMKQLYYLYTSEHGDASGWWISPNNFINFLVNNVSKNPEYSTFFTASNKEELVMLQTIVNAVVNETMYDAKGLSEVFSDFTDMFDEESADMMLMYYYSMNNYDESLRISLYDLIFFISDDVLNDDRFSEYFDSEVTDQIADAKQEIIDGKEALVGSGYSRLIIGTSFEGESEEVYTFIESLNNEMNGSFSEYYVIGNSALAYEMHSTFNFEFNMITIITAIAIFLIVVLTFRSFLIPLFLVLLITSALFLTMGLSIFNSVGVYFVAIIIVQAILMGATIDYAILYTSYYRKNRETNDILESIKMSYRGSMMTIMTSASILVAVTFIVGLIMTDPTISQVCMTVAKGSFTAAVLVIFLLPGCLAAFDKVICRKNKPK